MNMRSRLLLLTLVIAIVSLSAAAQTIIGTVNVQANPLTGATNVATNTAFIANNCGDDDTCNSGDGSVSVIDGQLNVQNIVVGDYPFGVAVNPVTNLAFIATCFTDNTCGGVSNGSLSVIDGSFNETDVGVGIDPVFPVVNVNLNTVYVPNYCGDDPNCDSQGTLSIVNGSDLSEQEIPVGYYPEGVAINTASNKIFVVNNCGTDPNCASDGTVTVVDATTLATQQVTVGSSPYLAAVDSVNNLIFVANNCGTDLTCDGNGPGTVTVINGNDLSTQTVTVGYYPFAISVNQVTAQVYVANSCGNDPTCSSAPTVSVFNESALQSVTTVAVCDVEIETGDFMGIDRLHNQIYVPCYGSQGLNGTTVSQIDGATNGVSTILVGDYPDSAVVNEVSSLIFVPNSGDDTTTVIAGNPTAPLQFVPVTPCRLVDTRPQNGGSGPIPGGSSANFAVPQLGGCNIPGSASAYSLNVTVVPNSVLGYLSIWPTGEDQPFVSTMNSLDGRVKANAAIVPAGISGAVSVFVSNTSNVVLDIDGYFTSPASQTLEFYPLTPCRVIDTRQSMGDLGSPSLSGGQERDFPVLESPCFQGVSGAAAYSFNFTVVPTQQNPDQPLGYLTVWPQGQNQPTVSTLNNPTATAVANGAIVPAGSGGGMSVFASNDTDLVVDINGYFAPASSTGLQLYAVAPCRALDTRNPGSGGAFQGALPVGITTSVCAPPIAAQAYVFNATVVPSGALGYLTLWPDGSNQPTASTLNALDGLVTSNLAIVPSTNGSIDAFASNLTQLILDISSYFAP